LLDRRLITTAGRKQVIGRPILYKTTKEFLLRFGLNDISELPSMEEFEKLGDPQAELFQTPEQPADVAKTGEAPTAEAPGSEPVTEADPAIVSEDNSNAAAETSEPERFNEAVAPVPGVDTLDRSQE
jgi:segregation and condensation protein B